MDAEATYRLIGDGHSGCARVGALRMRSLRLVRHHMKLRRPAVRAEDERGNPVSFFQLKEMAELEARKNTSRT